MNKEDSLPRFLDWSESPSLRYALLTVIFAVGLGSVTAVVNPEVSVPNIRALLTTLAIIEASVLAIVFSVTVVALQLVVRRYSARLASTFVEEPLFRVTIVIFLGAIACNLLFVYLLPERIGSLTNGAVGAVISLAVVSMIALYQFIQLMIHRASPDELITMLVEQRLAPEEYLPDAVAEFEAKKYHPIQPLYQTISSTIELGEFRSTEQGIEGLQTILIGTFEHLDTEYSEDQAAEYASTVSDEVLTSYMPVILEQLFNKGQYELLKSAIAAIEEIALDGLDRGFQDVGMKAAEGLGNTFDQAPLTSAGNRLHESIKKSLLTITKETATDANYRTFDSVFRQLNFQLIVLLRRRPAMDITDRLVGNYYSKEVVGVFEALVERYGSTVTDEDTNWIDPITDQTSLSQGARSLREFWRKYVRLSEAVLRYRISKETYPFAEGSLPEGWRNITKHAADNGLEDFATLCCMSMIRMAYHVDQIEDGRHHLWIKILGQFRVDYNRQIVDRAFSQVKAGDQPDVGNISVQVGDTELQDTDMSFIERILNQQDDSTFIDWVEDFHGEVKHRTEAIREQ